MAEELLKKCPKCGKDVFSGQRFCSSCGIEQKVSTKTSEQIQEMRGLIKEFQKKSGESEGGIPSLLFSFSAFIGADTALKWVMGYATDEELYKIMKFGKARKNDLGIHDIY